MHTNGRQTMAQDRSVISSCPVHLRPTVDRPRESTTMFWLAPVSNINRYTFYLYRLTCFLYRYKVGFAGPWEPATLTRRWEPALPVTRTRRLIKWPTAQHDGTRMKRDSREWHLGCSAVYIYKYIHLSPFAVLRILTNCQTAWASLLKCLHVLSMTRVGQFCRYAATSTVLISAFIRSAHLERVAHYQECSVARRLLPHIFRSARSYYSEVPCKSFRIFKTRLVLHLRLQSLECALMRKGLLRMSANENTPPENTRSSA